MRMPEKIIAIIRMVYGGRKFHMLYRGKVSEGSEVEGEARRHFFFTLDDRRARVQ